MALRHAALTLVLAGLAGCRARPPAPEAELAAVEAALRAGRIEEAEERIARIRAAEPRAVAAAQWAALVADLTWRDDDAVRAWRVAVRELDGGPAPADAVAELHGRLGDALFQAGRFGESIEPLTRGAIGTDAARRAAFAAAAMVLPYARKATGPLSSEQPLLPGDMPEFVCSAGTLARPFAIDTGTSMTTLSRSYAQQLQASQRRPAGKALDGAGRELPVEIGVLPKFAIGDIEFGASPVAIVDDAALQLRDEQGGPGRVAGGVLGLDLLGTCRLTLDPERRSVALEVPRGLPEAESVQCVRAEGRCLVPVFVDDVRLWFVLDTGASHSSLTEPGLRRLPGGVDRAMPGFRRVHTVGGSVVAVREVRDVVMRCSSVRFTGVVLPVVERRTSGLFPVHGVLGVDLLARCRVVLDGGRARLVGLP